MANPLNGAWTGNAGEGTHNTFTFSSNNYNSDIKSIYLYII